MSDTIENPYARFKAAFGEDGPQEPPKALVELHLDAIRIENRKPDFDQFRNDAIYQSYLPDVAIQGFDAAYNEKQRLSAKWQQPTLEAISRTKELEADAEAMARAFDTVNRIWFRFRGINLKAMQREMLQRDQRIVPNEGLWHHILSLDETARTMRDDFADLCDRQFNAWKLPPLRTWFRAAGVEAAGGGRLRLNELAPFEGVKIHMTTYLANIDGTVSIDDAIGTIMDTLFPPAAGGGAPLGTHVTFELFSADDTRNPRYFKGRGYFARAATIGETNLALNDRGIAQTDLDTALRDALNGQLNYFQVRIQNFIAERQRAVA